MQIIYKNKPLERVLIGANALAAAVVVASFVLLFGFHEPLLQAWFLYTVQVVLLSVFVAEKVIRMFNAVSKSEFVRANWFEIPLLLLLGITVIGAGRWYAPTKPESAEVRHFAVGLYLVVQVIAKL
jgi:trk system potassium uptake protein TrkH